MKTQSHLEVGGGQTLYLRGQKGRQIPHECLLKMRNKNFCEALIGVLLWTLTRDLAMMDHVLGASFTKFGWAHFCGF